MQIIHLAQIKTILRSLDVIPAIEVGFVAYSNGKVVLPSIGEMRFQDPPGDVHIKYGYIIDDDHYIVKIASGFYNNPLFNIPSSNGLMLLFSQKTGEPLAILLDEGYLTDIRTAAAGVIVAKYLAPSYVKHIGIIGTGTQARFQLHFLKLVTSCREVMVFGRSLDKLASFQKDMTAEGFNVVIAQDIKELAAQCNLIVTTTSATAPILFSNHIKKGTHITAVGADTLYKQELHENVFAIADVVVADSVTQCCERGDIAHAIKQNIIAPSILKELGNVIAGTSQGRTNQEQITIAALTGLAIQDIQIAKIVYQSLYNNSIRSS
ncbi:MAG: ornithine cyclodeaminase family protein [Alphaproteobacteria bacterium]|nr:ornithine cyclodeaminase family protein [Alphaproteobacteria bacterium]